MGWSPKELLGQPKVLEVSQTATPVHEGNSLYAGGATEALIVSIYVTGVAGVTTVQLQHSMGLGVWENVSGKVTGTLVNGWNHIKLHHDVTADAALMPLYDIMRLVYTSNGAAAGSITNIKVLQAS